MDPDIDHVRMTVSHARELADRAHHPQKVCEDTFYHRVKIFVEQQASMGHYKCNYTIPSVYFGLPLYSVHELAESLEKRFRREGWTVRLIGDATLELSWGNARRTVLKSLDARRR